MPHVSIPEKVILRTTNSIYKLPFQSTVLECFGNHRIRVALKSRQTLVASPASHKLTSGVRAQKSEQGKVAESTKEHIEKNHEQNLGSQCSAIGPKPPTINKRMFESCIKKYIFIIIFYNASMPTKAWDSLSETSQSHCRRNTKVQTNDHNVLTIANTMDRSAPMERILQRNCDS